MARQEEILTFRRAVLVALSMLALFLFFGGSGYKSAEQKLLEDRVNQVWHNAEYALKELQSSSDSRDRQQVDEIRGLQAQNRMLEKQIQQLRRLPDSASLRDQLRYQFPYKVNTRFPAYIWQTWKTPRDSPDMDEDIREYIESWGHMNVGFVHEVLTDELALKMVRHLYMNIPKVVEAYESMPEVILKADFFRYLILLARGGTYTDADTEALRPVPNWMPPNINPLEVGLVIGIEADPDRPDWHDWYARRIQFCQWTIEAKSGHPVLREIVANITEHTLNLKHHNALVLPQSSDRGSLIMDWTGPGIWTDTIFAYLNSDRRELEGPVGWEVFTRLEEPLKMSDVLTLPITSFSPGVQQMGAKEISDPMAFVHHHFGGSWKPERER